MNAAFAAITLIAFFSGPVFAQSAGTQTAAPTKVPATAAAPRFVAADVQLCSPIRSSFMDGGQLIGDRYAVREATMVQLIAAAYDMEPDYVQGGPGWLNVDRYDVTAKAPASTSPEALRAMLQSLLKDRFGLVVHKGNAPMPVYVLSAGKSPPKMRTSAGSDEVRCIFQRPASPPIPGSVIQVAFSCTNMPMERFAQQLRGMAGDYLDKRVVNLTGLKGSYDFEIKWTPRFFLDRAGADGVSIFDAVNKQLGLKLARESVPQPVLIIDKLREAPTPNVPDIGKILPPLPPPQFEVAVIRPYQAGERQMFMLGGDQMRLQGVTLKELITFAWELTRLDYYRGLELPDNEALVGTPPWLDKDRFDVLAKVPGSALGSPAPRAPRVDIRVLEQMMQGLLEERFKMRSHYENRPVTTYKLVAVNPKLKRAADQSGISRCVEGPGPDQKDSRIATPVLDRMVSCSNMTMARFGKVLPYFSRGAVYYPTEDDTGLKGEWDFTLGFSSPSKFRVAAAEAGASTINGVPTASEPNGALSIFDAIRSQLGLKLVQQKRPEPVLVIDHIEEQPTPN